MIDDRGTCAGDRRGSDQVDVGRLEIGHGDRLRQIQCAIADQIRTRQREPVRECPAGVDVADAVQAVHELDVAVRERGLGGDGVVDADAGTGDAAEPLEKAGTLTDLDRADVGQRPVLDDLAVAGVDEVFDVDGGVGGHVEQTAVGEVDTVVVRNRQVRRNLGITVDKVRVAVDAAQALVDVGEPASSDFRGHGLAHDHVDAGTESSGAHAVELAVQVELRSTAGRESAGEDGQASGQVRVLAHVRITLERCRSGRESQLQLPDLVHSAAVDETEPARVHVALVLADVAAAALADQRDSVVISSNTRRNVLELAEAAVVDALVAEHRHQVVVLGQRAQIVVGADDGAGTSVSVTSALAEEPHRIRFVDLDPVDIGDDDLARLLVTEEVGLAGSVELDRIRTRCADEVVVQLDQRARAGLVHVHPTVGELQGLVVELAEAEKCGSGGDGHQRPSFWSLVCFFGTPLVVMASYGARLLVM